jgi:hypothetical protein
MCLFLTQSGLGSAVSSAVTNRCYAVLGLHLLVSIDKEVVEIVNANETKPRTAIKQRRSNYCDFGVV